MVLWGGDALYRRLLRWLQGYGVERGALVRRRRECRERRTAIYLAKILSGGRNSEVGRQFNVRGGAVSAAIIGIENELKRSP